MGNREASTRHIGSTVFSQYCLSEIDIHHKHCQTILRDEKLENSMVAEVFVLVRLLTSSL